MSTTIAEEVAAVRSTPRTAQAQPGAVSGSGRPRWHRVCRLDDLEEAWGEAVLMEGRQIALFRSGGHRVFAAAQGDPATSANVMARGIVGSRGQRPTIASPLHKEVYDLQTGECFGDPELQLAVYDTRVLDGFVEVAL